MRSTPWKAACALAASLFSTAVLSQASFSVGNNDNIRFRWGVPETVASSGSGNVYMQIKAPDSYSWVGLGIGSQMRGAEIFLIYQDGKGNVTLSTREASGHSEPQYKRRSQVELLEGSGVSDGNMVANIRCGDCSKLDKQGQGDWIAAWHEGDALDSTSPEKEISVHNGNNVFQVNLGQAKVSSDGNPFVGPAGKDDGNNGNSGAVSGGSSGSGNNDSNIILAHGIVMTIVFVGLYPLGSIVMPLLGKWFIHSTLQLFAFLLMWAGFALGLIYANRNSYMGEKHVRIGISVVSLLGIQPVLGWLHHRHYAKHQGRGIISYVHIWYGRILLVLGIVNGGLGLKLAGKTDGAWVIAYSVVAGIMFIAYVVAIFLGARRRSKHNLAVKA